MRLALQPAPHSLVKNEDSANISAPSLENHLVGSVCFLIDLDLIHSFFYLASK